MNGLTMSTLPALDPDTMGLFTHIRDKHPSGIRVVLPARRRHVYVGWDSTYLGRNWAGPEVCVERVGIGGGMDD